MSLQVLLFVVIIIIVNDFSLLSLLLLLFTVIVVVNVTVSTIGMQGPGSAEGRPCRPHTTRQVLPPLHRHVLREGYAQCGRAGDSAHLPAHHCAVSEESASASGRACL